MLDGKLTYHDYQRFAALSLDELAKQCEVETFHASGPGGQGVNTADSAVRMRHVPPGITVVSREMRSQLQNRRLCLEKIHEVLRRRSIPLKARLRTRPHKAAVERRLSDKRHISGIKRLRRRPFDE